MYIQKSGYYNIKKQGGYDSKFEAGYAQELNLRTKAGDIKSYDEQVVLDLDVNGYHVCTYKIDFIVYHNDGITEYVETKGYPTPVWRLKFKLFESLYGDKKGVKITVVYQSNKFRPPKPRKLKL
jgi:hypothetical protein